jgi:hypothetical protein
MPLRGSASVRVGRTAIRWPSIVVIHLLSNPAGAGKESRWNAVAARVICRAVPRRVHSVDALADQVIVKVIFLVDYSPSDVSNYLIS